MKPGAKGHLPPLGLYVHLPWCVRKCPYCDFNSHAQRGPLPEAAYVDALLDDLRQDLDHAQDRPLGSIFIGGGTPSLFSADAIGRLLEGAAELAHFNGDIEITLEANPGTAEQQRFSGYRAAGVNRLSLGLQSLNDRALARLGRIHGRQDSLRAVAMARAAGFDNLNLDLMFGLPEQSVEGALKELDEALSLAPEHLSWYQLTLEPNTYFYRHPPPLPDHDRLWEMQQAGRQRLQDAGLVHYEVSAFARPGRHAKHNLNYWQFGDFLGIGAGAHGKVTRRDCGTVMRTWKVKGPGTYLDPAKPYLAGSRALREDELPFEFFLNGLRLVTGVPSRLFRQRTGLSLQRIDAPLAEARSRGLMVVDERRLAATERGHWFLNDLLELFL